MIEETSSSTSKYSYRIVSRSVHCSVAVKAHRLSARVRCGTAWLCLKNRDLDF